jgi:NAD(P)-dependent dehydrogenase (short-subunit alcohol dehydrogenase family)
VAGRLQGKVAVIMGAGSVAPGIGNGRAAAILFAREGAKVFAVDVNAAALEDTRQAVAAEGNDIQCFVGDVSDPESVQAVTRACVQRFGTINVLMNNVGIMTPGGVLVNSLEDWERVLRVNLTGPFLAAKYMIPVMIEAGGGSIVNVSTMMGPRQRRKIQYASYGVSKAGLECLTRSIAMEFAPKNVRANNLILGPIKTPQIEVGYAEVRKQYGDAEADRLLEVRKNMTPMQREGSVWEVANAALFLASDESGFTTGSDIWIDGGQGIIAD